MSVEVKHEVSLSILVQNIGVHNFHDNNIGEDVMIVEMISTKAVGVGTVKKKVVAELQEWEASENENTSGEVYLISFLAIFM